MRFESFDPYESVFAPDREPAFRNGLGDLVPSHSDASERLLALVVATSRYFMRPMRRDQWQMILESMDELADLLREQLTKLDAADRLFETGEPLEEPPRNWNQAPFAIVVEAAYGSSIAILRDKPLDPDMSANAFAGALCLGSLAMVDDALSAVQVGDAWMGVSAAMAAASMFADAKGLLDARRTSKQLLSEKSLSLSAREIGLVGAMAREKKYAGPRQFVREQWALHRHGYANNKSDFARHYVTLVLKAYGVSVKEKTIRETWLQDTL